LIFGKTVIFPTLVEGMRTEQKRKKTKRFFGTQPQKLSLGQMAQTPRAGTGDLLADSPLLMFNFVQLQLQSFPVWHFLTKT